MTAEEKILEILNNNLHFELGTEPPLENIQVLCGLKESAKEIASLFEQQCKKRDELIKAQDEFIYFRGIYEEIDDYVVRLRILSEAMEKYAQQQCKKRLRDELIKYEKFCGTYFDDSDELIDRYLKQK
jgi:hypothetical protein